MIGSLRVDVVGEVDCRDEHLAPRPWRSLGHATFRIRPSMGISFPRAFRCRVLHDGLIPFFGSMHCEHSSAQTQ